MIHTGDLEELRGLRSDDGIVSAYVAVEPRLQYDPNHPVTEFKGAVKRFMRRRASSRWRASLERERGDILKMLEEWRPSGRGVAIFCCRPAGIHRTLWLATPVPTLVEVDVIPRLAVLERVEQQFPPMIVVVIQKDFARILVSEQLESRRLLEISSEVPGRHDQGGESQANYQRHIAFHAAEHMKKVAEELKRLWHRAPGALLAVGGVEEVVARFVEKLPKGIAARFIGSLAVDLKGANDESILDRARELRRKHDEAAIAARVEEVISESRGHGQAVLGVRRALRNLVEGRVRELIFVDGFRPAGSICQNCRYFAPDRFDRCPICDGPSDVTDDVLSHVTGEDGGVAVTRVFEGEARERLQREGGVGALLRY